MFSNTKLPISHPVTHPRDKNITFIESTHTYIIAGVDSKITSVTSLIHSYFPSFNASRVVKQMMRKSDFSGSEYAGMTSSEIIARWSESGKKASEEGTLLHKSIEEFYLSGLSPSPMTVEFSYFLRFHEERCMDGWSIYRTEWSIYMEDLSIAGQLDALYKTRDGFVLCDWKRSKSLKMSNSFEKGFGVLSHMDNCNYSHYSVQLNLYKYILKNYYGLEVFSMFLIVLHPDQSNFQLVSVPDLSWEISLMISVLRNN